MNYYLNQIRYESNKYFNSSKEWKGVMEVQKKHKVLQSQVMMDKNILMLC